MLLLLLVVVAAGGAWFFLLRGSDAAGDAAPVTDPNAVVDTSLDPNAGDPGSAVPDAIDQAAGGGVSQAANIASQMDQQLDATAQVGTGDPNDPSAPVG